jgi:hypothetical protein
MIPNFITSCQSNRLLIVEASEECEVASIYLPLTGKQIWTIPIIVDVAALDTCILIFLSSSNFSV